MKTSSTQISRSQLRRLRHYLTTQWPEVGHGTSVETAIWLLDQLRYIADSGVLPAIGDNGEIVYALPQSPQTGVQP